MVDSTLFPISEQFAGALVYAAPNSLRQLHWHVGADEWEFIINGTVEVRLCHSRNSCQNILIQLLG